MMLMAVITLLLKVPPKAARHLDPQAHHLLVRRRTPIRS